MAKFFVFFGLFLLVSNVSGETLCGGYLSLLNFGDVDTGDWLNISVYTTVDINYLGVRKLDVSVLDPSGRVIYVSKLQLSDSTYVLNYSFFINEFWVDGLHQFNATIVTVNTSNPSQELCRRTTTVPFDVYSNRTVYENNVIRVDFKPMNFTNTKRLSKMVCFGGICQNMSLLIPLDVEWGIEVSNQSFNLPSDFNSTDYDAIITVENLCYNYSFVSGLYEHTRELSHYYRLEASAFNIQRDLLLNQNVDLFQRNSNCTDNYLNLSKDFNQLGSDYKIAASSRNRLSGELSQCIAEKLLMYSKDDLTWTAIGAGALTLFAWLAYVKYKSRTPDNE